MTILDEIFAHKRQEVTARRSAESLAGVRARAGQAPPPLDFVSALRASRRAPALIAEVKRASPSRGLLVANFDACALARTYAENGAAAISVLTDEAYFKGHLDDLVAIARPSPGQSPRLPLIRKDFICDEYQVYEARAAGADAVLLIVAGLSPSRLGELHALVAGLGMAALVEVHDAGELAAALQCHPRLIGINNRDLRDFSVSLETTLRLRPQVPAEVCVVAESGIHTPADVARLADAGLDAILVGEALVTAPDVAAAVRGLAEGGRVKARR
jgi:indole-3-glycerol phosphate synthase